MINSTNPLISVIIITYNMAIYLGEAIESVLNQTFRDYELIIVDDGSEDDTREIVEKHTRSPGHQVTRSPVNIKYIYQENKGRGHARQRGIDESEGEYIAFLDSDDKWLPQKLERQLNYIEKNSFSGLLHSKVIIIDENGIELKRENDVLKKDYYFAVRNRFSYTSLLYTCPVFLSSAILPKRLIFQAGKFREDYKNREDFDLILRLARVSDIEFLNEGLTFYRNHPANSSRISEKDVEESYITIYSEQLQLLDKIRDPKERKKAQLYIYNNLINFSHKLGDRDTAFSYLKELIKKQPSPILAIKELKNFFKIKFI